MRRHLLDSLRITTTFVAVFACFGTFPVKSLLPQNAVSVETFVFLLLLPGALALVLAPAVASLRDRRLSLPALTVMWSVMDGLALGLGLTVLLVTYHWYADPAASHLEPLSLLFAATTGAAVAARKRIVRIQTRLAESPARHSALTGVANEP